MLPLQKSILRTYAVLKNSTFSFLVLKFMSNFYFIYLFLLPVIENLPMEMREKLTEMREMDLQVSSKTCSFVIELSIKILQ